METEEESVIQQFHQKFDANYWFDDNGKLRKLSEFVEPLFGFELELLTQKADNEDSQSFYDEWVANYIGKSIHLGFYYDGGLERGFEIASKPCSLGLLLNDFDWSFLDRAQECGAQIGTTIGEMGFHVHIDRRSFAGDEHVRRFAEAIIAQVKNADEDKCDWFTENSYCRAYYDTNEYKSKYLSVNCSLDRTVEVRCLVPTFSESRIKEYLRYLNETINNTQQGDK